jgi:hypothetical protein
VLASTSHEAAGSRSLSLGERQAVSPLLLAFGTQQESRCSQFTKHTWWPDNI